MPTVYLMYIIGLSAHFHDSSACLIKDGQVLYAISEERLSRIKHDGSLPIVGVNLSKTGGAQEPNNVNLARSTEQEKRSQIERLQTFKKRHKAQSKPALDQLKQAAMRNENVFIQLMDAVRVCSLGQITNALFEVCGKYRRNM